MVSHNATDTIFPGSTSVLVFQLRDYGLAEGHAASLADGSCVTVAAPQRHPLPVRDSHGANHSGRPSCGLVPNNLCNFIQPETSAQCPGGHLIPLCGERFPEPESAVSV